MVKEELVCSTSSTILVNKLEDALPLAGWPVSINSPVIGSIFVISEEKSAFCIKYSFSVTKPVKLKLDPVGVTINSPETPGSSSLLKLSVILLPVQALIQLYL